MEVYCHLPNSLRLWSMPMPTPQYNINTFFASNSYLIGLVLAMGFLYPMSVLVKSIVEEKELRLKETLLILGVKPWAYLLSWMIVAYSVFLIGSILVSVALHSTIMAF
jgi:ABC-type Na+ efflux pump permease subunit